MNVNSLMANMSAIDNGLMNNAENKLNMNKKMNQFMSMLGKAMQQNNNLVNEESMKEHDIYSNISDLFFDNENNNSIGTECKLNNSRISILDKSVKDEELTDTEIIDYSNIMSMLPGMGYNNTYIVTKSDYTDTAARNLIQDTQQKYDIGVQKNQNITKNMLDFNNIESSDNKAANIYQFLMKSVNVQENHSVKFENESTVSMMPEKESKLNILKGAIFKEADKSKERLKQEIDSSRMIVQDKKSVFSDNKIIVVSNEASEIKGSIISQVKDKILLAAKDKDGIQSITMELFPKNLGKVDIKLSIEAKKITVEIFAANKEAGQILMSNADELAKTLQKSSGSYVDVTVSDNSLMSQYENSSLNYSSRQEERQYYSNNYGVESSPEKSDEDSTVIEMLNLRNRLNKIV